MEDQTTKEVKNYMSSDKQEGFGLFVFEDKDRERGYRKDIIKDISYKKTLELGEYFDCVGTKFVPYGFREDLDELVKNMVDGPFEDQLPEE